MANQTQPKKSPKLGIPLLFGFIVLVLIASGIYVFYRFANGQSIPTNNPLSKLQEAVSQQTGMKVTEAMFSDIEDPLIRKHFVKQYSQTSYQVTTTSSGRGAGQETVTAFSLMGDKMNLRTTEKENGKDINDTITIGDNYYVKDFTDNKWWMESLKNTEEIPGDMKDEIESMVPDVEEFMQEQVTKMSYVAKGQEACGNLTCYKYEEVDSSSPEGKRTFWFDTKELLLRKEVYGFGEFDSTGVYEYGVKVSAPSPTKEVPNGKSIFDYYNAGSAGSMPDYSGMDEGQLEDLMKSIPGAADYFGGEEMPANDPTTDTSVSDDSY